MLARRSNGVRPEFVTRGHRSTSWLFVAGVLAVVAWAVVQQTSASIPVRVVAALGAAAVPLVVAEVQARVKRREELDALVREHSRLPSGGVLPRVKEVRLEDMGVHRAAVDVPYITRDAEPDVYAALERRLLLIIGPSLAGKTRLAAEAIRRRYPHYALLFPEQKQSVRELLANGFMSKSVVVWLDDLDELLGEAFNPTVLRELINQGSILAATIRTDAYKKYLPRGEFKPPEWAVLERFLPAVRLDRLLSDAEIDRARNVIKDEQILAGIERYGLGQYVGAGRQAWARFEAGRDTDPVGHALVRAAADWRRVGYTRPAPLDVLVRLLPNYLDAIDQHPDDEAIRNGLQWAKQPISTIALLTESESGFVVFDYILDVIADRRWPVPDGTWKTALAAAADTGEALNVAYSAASADRRDVHERAWKQAAEQTVPPAPSARPSEPRWPLLQSVVIAVVTVTVLALVATIGSGLGPDPAPPEPPPEHFTITMGAEVSPDMPRPNAGRIEQPRATDVYEFFGAAGEAVYVEDSCTDSSIEWTLDSPNRRTIRRWSTLCTDSKMFDPGSVLLPLAGTYQLSVTSYKATTYSFRLVRAAKPQRFLISIGQSVTFNRPGPGAGRIEAAGGMDIYTFTGRARQTVRLRMLSYCTFPDLAVSSWTLIAPDGEPVQWSKYRTNEVYRSCPVAGTSPEEDESATLPLGGKYELRATAATTGSYSFQVSS
jgi:hypothetical protein